MAPLWTVLSVMEAVLISAGLGFHLLVRNIRSDAAAANDPSLLDDGSANLQEMSRGAGPAHSSTAGTAHDTEHPSSSASASASASPVLGHEFEVFLSFRGAEIRKSFLDCLYHNLTDVGVCAFKDNEEVRVGKEFGPDLMRAIKQSKISIPIFTRDYASSKWCLMEVAEMVKCMKDPGCKQHIIPIFFDVTPNQVRHQSGTYVEAFARHAKEFDPETVQGWREALKEVVKLQGLELNVAANGNQGEFIKLVIAEVLRELRQARLDGAEILVGLDDHAEELMHMLELGINDVRMVGIWGSGGIGKTTLAKYVYNRIVDQFECCSFLSDIRETSRNSGGLLELQRQLASDILGQQYHIANTDRGVNVLKSRLCGKKSLILLDDVDHINQLKALAVDRGSWFGSGTRILVTTREKGVLHQFPSCKIYEHQLLDEGCALELFRQYAFRDDSQSSDEYDDLSRDIVIITGGLPLALVVIGSFLFASRGKKEVWNGTIEQLKRKPNMQVQEKLRISYDSLTHEQKEIFLDIACFFIGLDYELVMPMWDDCQFFPELAIEVLRLKSLIKIGYGNQLQMHDQLRDLGRHIVEQESYKEPELRSRLWRSEEAIDVLRGEQGTSKIEAAEIWPSEGEGVHFSSKCFKNLSKLRILWLRGGAEIAGDFQHLLPKLRWLRWSTKKVSAPPTNLSLKNLTVLCLSFSGVDEDWIGWNSIKMERLKVLDLSSCKRLRKIHGFSAFPNLKRLILESCSNLVSIDPSIELLKNLNFLNLRSCWELKKLPKQLGNLEALVVLFVDDSGVEEVPVSDRMKKLEILSANCCYNLNHIPREIGSLVNLKKLFLEECLSLWELPDTIGQLKSLIELHLQNSGIRCLPKTLQDLKELQVLDTSGCSSLEPKEVPVNIRSLFRVRVLTLHLGDAERSPTGLSGLSHLETLHLILGRGWSVETLPEIPLSLISLTIEGSSTRKKELNFCGDHMKLKEDWLGRLCKLETLVLRSVNINTIPETIVSLSCLKEIKFDQCAKLEHLPTLPPNLRSLSISDCCSLRKLPSLSNLRKLSELTLRYMRLREIDGFGDLISLQKLFVHDCHSNILDGVERMESLHELSITSCDVERLPELSNLQRLRRLHASNNRQLVDVQGINNLLKLESVDFSRCTALERLDGVETLDSLKFLTLGGCEAIEELPDLSRLQNLHCLSAGGCEKLHHVEGLGELVSLSKLDISGCKAIEELPDLSRLPNLRHLHVGGIKKLQQLESIRELGSLESLVISGCKDIVKLPHLSILQRLRFLNMRDCEKLTRIDGLGEAKNLEDLDISGCNAIEDLSGLSKLQRLRSLRMQAWEQPEQIAGLEELDSLEELYLSKSKTIERLPDLSKSTRLSVLEMEDCENLSQIDNLEKLRSVEILNFSRCKAIEKLPELSKLQSLRHLNMRECKMLTDLDRVRGLGSLEKLDISLCEVIEKLPELSKLQSLRHLTMRGCGKLIQLDGIGELVSLEQLDISQCDAIEKLPKLSKLHRLQHINMGGCKKLKQLDGIQELVSLKKLDISRCIAIEELPELLKLQSIQHLIMRGCKKLKRLDGIRELASLEQLDISWCIAIEKLPELPGLLKLRQLSMRGCEKLTRLDGIGELVSLQQLDISGCKAIEKLPNLSKLKGLWHLNMRGCEKLSGVDELEELESLEELALSRLKSVEKLPDLSKWKRLRWLEVKSCEKLCKLEGLEELESLEHLAISRCGGIEKLPDLSKLQALCSLQLEVRENLHHLDGLKEMDSLRKLDISGSKAIEKLPELPKPYYLSHLYLRNCNKLRQLDELGELVSLEELDISGCTAIGNLPDLSQLNRLSKLKLKACKKLLQLEGLGELGSLKELDVSGCKSLEKLPDLSRLQSLRELRMEGCGKLRQLEGLQELELLLILRVSGCKGIEKLPDLSKLQYLSYLGVTECKKLRQLEGLVELKLLVELNISGCEAIEKLVVSSNLHSLKKLKMEGCRSIRAVHGLEKLSELRELCISGCKLLNLPDLSHLKDLRIRK